MDLDALLSQLSPEEIAELMGMGTLDERGSLLDQQLAQAQALRQPQSGPHSTGMGAALGGLGDAVRSFSGGIQELGLRDQQRGLLNQKDQGRQKFLEMLRQRQGGRVPGSAGMGDLGGGSLFGMG